MQAVLSYARVTVDRCERSLRQLRGETSRSQPDIAVDQVSQIRWLFCVSARGEVTSISQATELTGVSE